MTNVQVRDVPDQVHRRLKTQAASAGQSLNEYLLARFADIARTPTIPELAERIRKRGHYRGPSSAAVIREDRDRR
jgi:antitoxin FitA